MKYTINGKEYTEFEVNKRCAELMGFTVQIQYEKKLGFTKSFHEKHPHTVWCAFFSMFLEQTSVWEQKVFTRDATDAWSIIEKCWDELTCVNNVILGGGVYSSNTEWDEIIDKHSCTKLVAACICFIEINEVQHDSTI
jgi:hypothetical protein